MEKEDLIIELIRNLGKDQQRLEKKLDTEISKVNTELSKINNKIDTESVKVNTELSKINNKVDNGLARLEKKIDTESVKVNSNIIDMKKDIRWKFDQQDEKFKEIKEILIEEKKRVDEIYAERKNIKITWSLPFVWFNAGISACIAFVIGIWK